MSNEFEIKTVKGINGLLSIKDEWQKVTSLLDKKRFYHLYEWYESYLTCLEKFANLVHFFILYCNNIPLAIFPLKEINKKILGFNFRGLEVPDHDHIDLSDFIYSNNPAPELLIYFLNHLNSKPDLKWDFIHLPHVLAESPTISFINRISVKVIEKCAQSDSISCSDYEKNLSKNFRRNLTKARNKLLNNNHVQFYSVKTYEDLLSSFNIFLDIEASGWKGEKGTETAIKLHRDLTAFYRALIRTFSSSDNCSINLLKIGQQFVSGQFCLTVGDTCYVLKICYDERYSKLAPGNLLLENLLDKTADNPEMKFISLVTASKWHQDWQPLSQDVFRLYLFKRTILSFLAFCLLSMKKSLRLFYQRFLLT